MIVTFSLLCVLIGTVPGLLFVDDVFVLGGLAAGSAAGLLLITATMRREEMTKLAAIFRPVIIPACVPLVWMVTQVLPLKFLGLAHPMWESAEAVLGYSLNSSVSIDPGATLLSAGYYLTAVALVLVAAAVALDRRRAELILNVLICVTSAIAVLVIVGEFSLLFALGGQSAARGSAITCAVLGTTLAAAANVRALERHATRRGATRQYTLPSSLAPWILASIVCWAALLLAASYREIVVAACSLAVLFTTMMVRRFNLGMGGYLTIAALATAAVGFVGLGIFAIHLQPTRSAQPSLSLTDRMLTDRPWPGTGAGTFKALLPMYRDTYQSSDPSGPAAAVTIAIELGQSALWVVVVGALSFVAVLITRALQRGRDAFYPAVGAGCVVALLLLGFFDPGIFAASVVLIATTVIGLAMAQSVGRTGLPAVVIPGPQGGHGRAP